MPVFVEYVWRSEGRLRRFFAFFRTRKRMYIPDPIFALVICYLADGDPAPRVLLGFDRTRRARGWTPGRVVPYTHPLLRGSGRDWGAIRRLIDTVAYLTLTGRRAPQSLVLICPREVTSHVWGCLMGTWAPAAPPPFGIMKVVYAAFNDRHYRLTYKLDSRRVELDIGSYQWHNDRLTNAFIMRECVDAGEWHIENLLCSVFVI